MKKLFFALCLIFVALPLQVFSQTSNYSLSGTVVDQTTGEKIGYPSVRILHPKDSTLIAGGSAGDDGRFSYMLKPGDYVLKISFLGYLDYTKRIKLNRNLNLGNIALEENSIQLSEAIVETNAIEVMVKGDTIEYNANAYKVQESAVVEDLLKKMPGVEIDENGKITINGKEVKKIMLEGKEFFSDDPKVASKNLPAQMVDRLQVLDKKSDMALMTGFDDGEEETIINLIAKPGMKQGAFGNLLGGYGSKDRYEANGMLNYLKNNTQFSVLGGINNTNNAGMSDLGSAMFESSGGGRGPGMRFGGQNGETKSITGGFNFATEHSDKLKWGGDIRFGDNNNFVKSNSKKSYTSGKNPGEETTDSWGRNKGQSYAANLRFEWTPDSLTKIVFRPRIEYNTNNNQQHSTTDILYSDGADRFGKDNSSIQEYSSKGNGYKLNGNLDMSRKLNSKGRVLSFGLRGGYSKSELDGYDRNIIDYSDELLVDSIIDQRFFQDDKSYNWRAFASWVEPLGRNNFLELSYNISSRNSQTNKETYSNSNLPDLDLDPIFNVVDTANTRFVENNFINQNISLKFRAQRRRENGHTYNYTLGIGLEPSSSKTTLREPNRPERDIPRRSFQSFAPTGQFQYYWDRRHNIRIDYNGTTNEPTTAQLYDGVYSRNGLNTTSGNPNLKPSFENRLNLRYHNFNVERESFMGVFARFTHTSNDIISTSTTNQDGGRDINYRNVNGNMSGNVRFVFNQPLKNKKWSINSMSYVAYNINNTFVDGDKNKAKTLTLQEHAGIRFRSDIFETSLRGNIRYNNVNNTLTTRNNQGTFNYGGTYDFTLYVPNPLRGVPFFEHILSDLTIESDLNYSTNSGYSDGFKQQEWLWNASLSKQVFKSKSGTIRFKMYDILKERSNINRNITSTYIEDITTNIIPSYFMVHFVYRFQTFKGGAKMQDMNGGERRGPHGGGRPPRG